MWLKIMQTIHDSFISSRPMDMILKLLHDSLYMGAIARHYQIHVKHMHKYWPHLIISQHCYHCPHTVSTYQHEFFECGIMPQVWLMINQMLDDAGLPSKLTSIAGLPEFLYEAHNPQFNLRKIVNTNLIIITLKAAWDAYQDKQNMTAHKYSRDIRRRLAMYITNEIKLLPCHIDNAYKHGYHTIGGNNRLRKRHTEREKMLLNKPSLRSRSLTDNDIEAYEDIWLPMGIITIAVDRKSISVKVIPKLPP